MPIVYKSWEPQPPGTLRACWDCFTFDFSVFVICKLFGLRVPAVILHVLASKPCLLYLLSLRAVTMTTDRDKVARLLWFAQLEYVTRLRSKFQQHANSVTKWDRRFKETANVRSIQEHPTKMRSSLDTRLYVTHTRPVAKQAAAFTDLQFNIVCTNMRFTCVQTADSDNSKTH